MVQEVKERIEQNDKLLLIVASRLNKLLLDVEKVKSVQEFEPLQFNEIHVKKPRCRISSLQKSVDQLIDATLQNRKHIDALSIKLNDAILAINHLASIHKD